ncbi:MAG: hypothetical protein KDC27_05510 [Acidobacteria bacterium]|nr:hypothetical protein [Acidobacteriota bacterium]
MGTISPGWRWGPFTARVPLLHLKPQGPELAQGLLVANATGLAVVPLYAEYFGMGFEIAVALVVLQSLAVYSSFLLFGEPFCPGWLTPALPLVLRETALWATPDLRTEFVNAVVLATAAVFLLFGATGLGKAFLRAIPRALKAGIILGAGLSALYGETLPRSGGRPSRLDAYPVCIGLAVGVTLLLIFSKPLEPWKRRLPWLGRIAALGVAPGFFLAMVAGPWLGEISYQGFFDYDGQFFFWPDFDGLVEQYSVLGLGLPPAAMWLRAAPLALAAYIIGFGDIITGTAILEEAARDRPDDPPPLDPRRTHLSIGLRNLSVALVGGPFFPLQGPLWTGATVVVAERWRRGPQAMRSLMDGVASYYVFGLPLLYFIGPALELLRPALDIAFSLTLILTGFACAYVALGMLHERVERGVSLLVAATILFFSTPVALLLGLLLTAGLLGPDAWKRENAMLRDA